MRKRRIATTGMGLALAASSLIGCQEEAPKSQAAHSPAPPPSPLISNCGRLMAMAFVASTPSPGHKDQIAAINKGACVTIRKEGSLHDAGIVKPDEQFDVFCFTTTTPPDLLIRLSSGLTGLVAVDPSIVTAHQSGSYSYNIKSCT